MLYAKIENQQIIQIAPLSVLFPNTGHYSVYCTPQFKQENNLMDVVDSMAFDEYTQRLIICDPYIKDGKVYLVKTEEMSITDQEIYRQNKIEGQWFHVRQERNNRLLETDYTQLPDSPVDKTAYITYRQQLRDITTQVDPFNINWPTKP